MRDFLLNAGFAMGCIGLAQMSVALSFAAWNHSDRDHAVERGAAMTGLVTALLGALFLLVVAAYERQRAPLWAEYVAGKAALLTRIVAGMEATG